MFTIKVVLPVLSRKDFTPIKKPTEMVIACSSYDVEYEPTGQPVIYYKKDEHDDDSERFFVNVHNKAYVMNALGKTIDTYVWANNIEFESEFNGKLLPDLINDASVDELKAAWDQVKESGDEHGRGDLIFAELSKRGHQDYCEPI